MIVGPHTWVLVQQPLAQGRLPFFLLLLPSSLGSVCFIFDVTIIWCISYKWCKSHKSGASYTPDSNQEQLHLSYLSIEEGSSFC